MAKIKHILCNMGSHNLLLNNVKLLFVVVSSCCQVLIMENSIKIFLESMQVSHQIDMLII